MDNPELLQQMIRLNPQMNQIMEQNPEIAHMFNNPALLRQVMEMQRNPSMMQVTTLVPHWYQAVRYGSHAITHSRKSERNIFRK